ncbi:MAG: cell division protein FtsZ, partial [bacterium]
MALVKPDSARIAKIKIIGIGGGGGNAVSSMVETDNINGVEFVVMNTDAQVLLANKAPTKLQIGEKITKGLGVGGDQEIGQQAAEESNDSRSG